MTDDAKREASEVLHSLLRVERINDKSQIIKIEKEEVQDDNIVGTKSPDAVNVESDTADSENDPLLPQNKKIKMLVSKKAKKLLLKKKNNEDSLVLLEDSPEEVLERLNEGCECKEMCFEGFNAESVYKHRLNIAELTKIEHDMYLMGVTMACLAKRNKTNLKKERIRQRAFYVYQGKKVCLDAFLYLENVTRYHLKRIRNHVMTQGVIPRVHGNLGKKPHNTFPLDMYKTVENFLKKYLKQFSTELSKYLVIHGKTRANIYNSYKLQQESRPNEKIMGYATFRHFMRKQFPNVRFSAKTENQKSNISSTSNEIKTNN